MVAQLNQPQTSIVDLPEENRELSADELPLVVGGYPTTAYGTTTDFDGSSPAADAIHDN